MNSKKLEIDLINQIKELQLKLGYAYESTCFYYRTASLAALVEADTQTAHELCVRLNQDKALKNTPLGSLIIRPLENKENSRVEITVPAQGALYVHEQVETPAFLVSLIQLFLTNHHPSKEEILTLFKEYSDNFIVQDMPEESDFDFGVHFANPEIDSHYYCFKEEMGHMIYHRFLEQDYKRLLE